MTSVFRCPVCRAPLPPPGGPPPAPWRCPTGHSFDAAREGYVNLLITHQRRQRDPGDSADMLRHRRSFLDAGHYAPLADAVAVDAVPGLDVLDAGCGEGYYTRAWPSLHEGLRLWGVDIARPAVRMAARRAAGAPRTHYAVASVYDLPVVDGSVDLVVSVFAPLHSAEFERVLRPGGRLVTATPGPDHLDGLKAKLFEEPSSHPARGPFEGEGATTDLRSLGTERVRYHLDLEDATTVSDLLHMTPYAWYVSPEVRAAVVAEGRLSTTIDFLVSRYERPAAFPTTQSGHE